MIVLNGVDSLQQVAGDIGESTDLWTNTQTLMGFSAATYKHIHNPGYIIPATGAVIKVTSAAGAGDFGDFVDVVGAGAINRAFDIHWISITNIEAIGVHIIELHRLNAGTGASEVLLCQVPVTRTNNFSRHGEVYTQIPVQPANARVGARMLRDVADAKFVEFIAHYHDYE